MGFLFCYQEKKARTLGSRFFLWYTTHVTEVFNMQIFNKNFYKFVFGFITVIAATLALVLIVGVVGK